MKELKQPAKFQKKNYFKDSDMLAIITTNEFYNKVNMRNKLKEVIDLPPVNNDYRNIKQTVKMMGFQDKNIIKIKNASSKQMNDLIEKIQRFVMP